MSKRYILAVVLFPSFQLAQWDNLPSVYFIKILKNASFLNLQTSFYVCGTPLNNIISR